MKYKYTVKNKGQIFSRGITSIANSIDEIESSTGVNISSGAVLSIEKGKKTVVEDEFFIVTIEKVK